MSDSILSKNNLEWLLGLFHICGNFSTDILKSLAKVSYTKQEAVRTFTSISFILKSRSYSTISHDSTTPCSCHCPEALTPRFCSPMVSLMRGLLLSWLPWSFLEVSVALALEILPFPWCILCGWNEFSWLDIVTILIQKTCILWGEVHCARQLKHYNE